MNETELADQWAALEPTPGQQRRIDARVRGWLDARESWLAAEWIGFINLNPIEGLSLAAAAAGLVLVATPLSWVAFSVL
ncbi:MAG: hypothetical protein WDM77_05890 [Steroidobacteraceae bacterium]